VSRHLWRSASVLSAVFALAACTPAKPAPTPLVPAAKPAPSAAPPPDPEPFRGARPPSGAAGEFQYPTPELLHTKNQLPVYVIARPSRVVAIKVLIRHGSSVVDSKKSGLAGLTARMLTESTRKKSSAALAEAVESLGATLNSDASRDDSEVSLTVLPGDVPRALELLAEVVLTPAFTDADFTRVRAEWLDGLRSERQDPQRLATLAAVRGLFGPQYGAPVDGRLKDVEGLTVSDLREFHKTAYTPDSAALLVVGAVDPKALLADAERTFGAWRGKSGVNEPETVAAEAPTKPRVLIADRAGAVQSAISALEPFPRRSEPGFEARQVVGRILGGLFTSRLNSNLREKHAYTYGAFSHPVATRAFGTLVVSTSVRTDVTAPALDEILNELGRIHDPTAGAPITDGELQRAKADLIFSLGATLEHPSHIAGIASDLFVDGLPLDYHTRYPALIRALDRSSIERAAAAVSATQLLIVIVGDRSKIEPELKKRGHAPEAVPSDWLE
jgi:zinc protease